MKHHVGVVYTVFGFAPAPEDQAASTSALMAALDKWGKTFLKGKTYVLGDKLSIADFKVDPHLHPHPHSHPHPILSHTPPHNLTLTLT